MQSPFAECKIMYLHEIKTEAGGISRMLDVAEPCFGRLVVVVVICMSTFDNQSLQWWTGGRWNSDPSVEISLLVCRATVLQALFGLSVVFLLIAPNARHSSCPIRDFRVCSRHFYFLAAYQCTEFPLPLAFLLRPYASIPAR